MLEQTTTVPDSKSVLTIVEIARLLRCSKAHVCNLMAGKVRGAPKLTHVCLERRRLSTVAWVSQWLEEQKPVIRSGSCQDYSPHSQERENEMRRKRFVRGCLAARKRRNRRYWYAQWSENGERRCKELGLCSEMNRAQAAALLADILKPINSAIGRASECREVPHFRALLSCRVLANLPTQVEGVHL